MFAVHIFSRATSFLGEQSRTNGRDNECSGALQFKQLEQANTPNEKRTLFGTGCPQRLYRHGGGGARAQGGKVRDLRSDQQRSARAGEVDWPLTQDSRQRCDPARML